MTKLIFVQLNEVNFDVVEHHIQNGAGLPNFERLQRSLVRADTVAESEYDLLEPWIQWVSVYTGKSFADHNIFRLGESADQSACPEQIFKTLEQRGLQVGAVASMNALNNLEKASYFVPDPWTPTSVTGNGFVRRFYDMIRQTVSQNSSGKISIRSLLILIETALRTLNVKQTSALALLALSCFKKPWQKAVALDRLVHMVHLKLWRAAKPDCSFVFLNAGAHVQHHYFFNSDHAQHPLKNPAWYVRPDADPLFDTLLEYDRILGDYLDMANLGTQLVVATGLSQKPYDRLKFYYRLSGHADFLRTCGVTFAGVSPLMTRDFVVSFANQSDATSAFKILGSLAHKSTGKKLFGDFQAKEDSLFLSLVYPDEILPDDEFVLEDGSAHNLGRQVDFVALKNGMHATEGVCYFSQNDKFKAPDKPVDVKQLHNLVMSYFP